MTARCANGKCESVELTNVPCVRRPARRAARGGGPRHAHGRRRLRRHVVRDRGRGGARFRARAVGGCRALACRRADPGRRPRPAAVRPPREPRDRGSQHRRRSPSRGGARERCRRTRSSSRPGRLDRSATGTGLSARMAALHARGLHGGRRRDDARVGDRLDVRGPDRRRRRRSAAAPAIVPAIRGSAWITGVNQLVVDPDDPFPEGYVLSDTWPGPDVQ